MSHEQTFELVQPGVGSFNDKPVLIQLIVKQIAMVYSVSLVDSYVGVYLQREKGLNDRGRPHKIT